MSGTLCLETQWPDDFGNVYVPYTIRCTDDFGNLWLVAWHFNQINFDSRYYFLKGD